MLSLLFWAFLGGCLPPILGQINFSDYEKSQLFETWKKPKYWIILFIISLSGVALVYMQIKDGTRSFTEWTVFQLGVFAPTIIMGLSSTKGLKDKLQSNLDADPE